MMPSTKQSIRKRILSLREQLPAEVRAAQNTAITERLLALPEYQRAGTVLGYMNFGSEFASELWIAKVLNEGKRLALPRVNKDTGMLDLYWVDDTDTQLQAGSWGIREPLVERCEKLNNINEVEFGIAFSREGARLGYGGGFYDKLLACGTAPALVVGAYGLQIVTQIPQEETDVSIGRIVTEAEIISCKRF